MVRVEVKVRVHGRDVPRMQDCTSIPQDRREEADVSLERDVRLLVAR